ncbi:MAG TPA: hypothetical protein VHV52_00980, partial [Gaiellaceae bacterium]|nr:hypothetical protein [Gaiellaceae bacterium]
MAVPSGLLSAAKAALSRCQAIRVKSRAAGCKSSAEWYARAAQSDYRAAARVVGTADALRSLPALDEALSTGALSLDQV